MPTEWLRVMLEEVARKRAEVEHGRAEAARRAPPSAPAPPQGRDTARGVPRRT
jgi:hypothetical protein